MASIESLKVVGDVTASVGGSEKKVFFLTVKGVVLECCQFFLTCLF